jgi:tetratricopeptide (TPR) repeat protein
MFSFQSSHSRSRPETRLLPSVVAVTLFILLAGVRGVAQGSGTVDHMADSLKNLLSGAKTDAEKVYDLSELSDYFMTLDDELSGKYARQALEVAELSRDRRLITLTYLRNGNTCIGVVGLQGKLEEGLESFQHAEKEARENNLDAELSYSYTGLARLYRAKGEYEKSLNYNNLAISIASASGDDSVKTNAYISMGNTYRVRNEQLLAFRSYLQALTVAELSKKDELLSLVYGSLAEFYGGIEEYDKAIDYDMRVLAIHRADGKKLDVLSDYVNVGRMFTRKKEIDLALKMYESSIALADSMRVYNFNLNAYLAIANMYFSNNQDLRGMQYLNNHRQLLDYFINSGRGFLIDQGYGTIYTDMGNYDSAAYFFKRAEPEIEKKTNQVGKYIFYQQIGVFYKAKGENGKAIDYFLKARKIGMDMKDISILESCDQYLDSLYTRTGDFRTAYQYNTSYNKWKDSLQTMSKQTDVLKLEVESDNRRRERLAREEEENTVRRHNIQYMGLTAGLAGLFIVLVMLGFFMISPRTIRALGFFSFIFLFEFIILLTDKQIHEWTHGEPWKVILIKIFLAAVLLPLHHWLEHKVIHYLTSRRKIAGGIAIPGKGKAAAMASGQG